MINACLKWYSIITSNVYLFVLTSQLLLQGMCGVGGEGGDYEFESHVFDSKFSAVSNWFQSRILRGLFGHFSHLHFCHKYKHWYILSSPCPLKKKTEKSRQSLHWIKNSSDVNNREQNITNKKSWKRLWIRGLYLRFDIIRNLVIRTCQFPITCNLRSDYNSTNFSGHLLSKLENMFPLRWQNWRSTFPFGSAWILFTLFLQII